MKPIINALFMIIGLHASLMPTAVAEGLNLSSGTAEVAGATSISLQNLSVDEKFYNAVIQLNLDGTYQVLSAQSVQLSKTAQYKVIFESFWSSDTHPYQFPTGSAHYSGLIGATHRGNFRLWEPGEIATPGIKSMAETGNKFPLMSEIETAIDSSDAEMLLSGSGLGFSPGQVSLTFEMTQAYPFVSLVSMIAPSPDWFIGVSGVNLIEDGQWLEELSLMLYAFDAGTDSGGAYTSSNQASIPQGAIRQHRDIPFLVGDKMPPMGRFVFQLIKPKS